MKDKLISFAFQNVIRIDKIFTMFYMELPKNFQYSGEQHDFWELVYIDKGEMLCTAGTNRFTLKSGEMVFHKPGEFHNLSGNNTVASNIGILCFQCESSSMQDFENKIFRLSAQDKALLSALFSEGLSCYYLTDPNNPLLPNNMNAVSPEPFGSSQMVKNLLEIFLIRLSREQTALPKVLRQNYIIDGVDVPYPVKEILDYLHRNIYGKVTVADVAAAVGKGESTVKQLFSLYRDGGIMKYYNNLKMKEAKKLIREGHYNMAQIADLLHYDSPQYFSKCFKASTNMTPSEYKRSIMQ